MAKILGIDPGTTNSAYVIWDGAKIHEKDWIPNHRLLAMIHNGFPGAEQVVIEMQIPCGFLTAELDGMRSARGDQGQGIQT